jgi:hypothetical protein
MRPELLREREVRTPIACLRLLDNRALGSPRFGGPLTDHQGQPSARVHWIATLSQGSRGRSSGTRRPAWLLTGQSVVLSVLLHL